MSLPQKEEHGVKSSPWSTSDLAMGVPIKKRRFLFTRSPSPPSQSTAFPADDGKTLSGETTSPTLEASFSQVSGQDPGMGSSDLRDSSLVLMAEHSTEGENKARDCGSSLSFSGLKFALGTNTSNETVSEGNAISENASALGPILGAISEKSEVRLNLGCGSSGNKLSSNDKSAFQSDLSNSDFPFRLNLQSEAPSGESIKLSIKQESGHFELEPALPERQLDTLSEEGSKFGASLVRHHSSRSHWNLNTTIDTWEGSTVDKPLNHGPDGNEDPDLGDINQKASDMNSVEKVCQESSGALALSWNCEASGGASSPKLSNTLNLPGESCAVNTDLNLHLNPAFGSTSHSTVSVSFSPAILASRRAHDLSLSTESTSLTQGSDLATCGAAKTEPVDGDCDKNSQLMEAGNLESASVRDIKLETPEAVGQESAKSASLSASGTVCGVAIKLEQLEVPILDGLSFPQGSSHSFDSLNKKVTAPVANGGSGVDCKNMHGSPVPPNVDASQVTRATCTDAATVSAAKTFVPDDTVPDVGQDMPFNANPPHHAGPSINSSPNITSRHAISDVSGSQSIDLPSIPALQEDVKVDAIKISELSSEPTPTEEKWLAPLKGAEVVDDSKGKEEEVAHVLAEICEQVPHSDDCARSSGCISVDVTTSDKSVKNGLIDAEAKSEEKKLEMSEIGNVPLDSRDAVSVNEAVPKLHTDNDDYEDGELRESLLRGASRVSCNINEKKAVDVKSTLGSDVHAAAPSMLVGNEGKPEKPGELKDVHCTTESGTHPRPANIVPDSNVSGDMKESSAGHAMTAEPKKRKAAKITRRMPQSVGKKDPEANLALKKVSNMSCTKGPGDIIGDLGGQLVKESVDQSSQLKAGVPQNDGADKHARSRNIWGRMVRLCSSPAASSGGRRAPCGRSSPWLGKERIGNKQLRREKVHSKSSRDGEGLSRMPRFGKDGDLDQAMQMARSDGLRMRGRISYRQGSPNGSWDTDRGYAMEHFSAPSSCLISSHKHAAEPSFAVSTDDIYGSPGRILRRHLADDYDDGDDEELQTVCRHLPGRSPSPGRRGPLPDGLRVVHRTMRDLGPGRRSGGAAGGVSILREENLSRGFADGMVDSSSLIRRERRSLSPQVSRVFSHHSWHPPPRSPEVFDGRPSLMRRRSPDDMPSRGHNVSPHFSRLHAAVADTPRFDYELGNSRRMMNPDYAADFCPPPGDELRPEERRMVQGSRRQPFLGRDDSAGHSRSFIPGPIGLHHEPGEDFPRRAPAMRAGGDLRNRLGNNIHRRLTGMGEQEGDHGRDSGQGWHGGRLKDARLKRRRF